jgi:hypothetical protein
MSKKRTPHDDDIITSYVSSQLDGSRNTFIISGDEILSIPARTNHNRENPITGYDYHFPTGNGDFSVGSCRKFKE